MPGRSRGVGGSAALGNEVLGRVLGKPPEHTQILIQEIADEDWGFAGMLTDDYRKLQS